VQEDLKERVKIQRGITLFGIRRFRIFID